MTSSLKSLMVAVIATGAASAALPINGQAKDVFRPDRPYFFQQCRVIRNYKQPGEKAVLDGTTTTVTHSMEETLNTFFDRWEIVGDGDKRKLAYIVATAYRESRGTFKALRESAKFGTDEARREHAIGRYLADHAKPGKAPKPNYAIPEANGQRYYGRGYNQLTHPWAYQNVSKKLGMGNELYDAPDKVLRPEISIRILVDGMLAGGWFGRTRLSDHFSETREDWDGARITTNPGSPHMQLTGELARDFNRCLR